MPRMVGEAGTTWYVLKLDARGIKPTSDAQVLEFGTEATSHPPGNDGEGQGQQGGAEVRPAVDGVQME